MLIFNILRIFFIPLAFIALGVFMRPVAPAVAAEDNTQKYHFRVTMPCYHVDHASGPHCCIVGGLAF